MQQEKCKCKAIQWQKVGSVFLILNQELDANEDREGYELPRTIHWHRSSARTSLWQSKDVSVTCTGWINCASLEAEFIKYGIILESESDFLSLQCSTVTPGTLEGLECYFLYLWFSFAAFLFLFFYIWKTTVSLLFLAPSHTLKDAQYLPLQNPKSCKPLYDTSVWRGAAFGLSFLFQCKTPLKLIKCKYKSRANIRSTEFCILKILPLNPSQQTAQFLN